MEGTKDTSTNSDNFVLTVALNTMVLAGAELVDEHTFQMRKSTCESCDFYKNVLFKGLEIKGCSICGCPLDTKGKTSKYFSILKGGIVKTICPHEEGNKWEFLNQNT